MAEFRTVCQVSDLAEGQGRAFKVQDRLIAVFLHQGQYFAIDDVCPHMGAALSDGYVEEGVVTCPWHAWRFQLCDGAWMDYPKGKTRVGSYPVRVQDGQVQVQM